MKKLLFTAILSCLLLPCFSNAWMIAQRNWYIASNGSMSFNKFDCVMINDWTCKWQAIFYDSNMENPEYYNWPYSNYLYCFTRNWIYYNSGGACSYSFYKLSDIFSCPACQEQYTSLECQTEYNLIPIESVTASYCKLNYDLIEPTECPINTWTGDISRTPRFINNSQYPWTALLRITIPEFIWYSVTYNTEESYIEIEWLNADTNYIENVINNEKLTPTNEDFEKLIWWLATFIPYLFIALLIIRMVKIFNKIWK